MKIQCSYTGVLRWQTWKKLTFIIYCLLSATAFNKTVLARILLKSFFQFSALWILFKKTTCHYSMWGFGLVWFCFILFCFVGGYQGSSRTGRWYPWKYYKTCYWEPWIQTESRSARQSNNRRKVRGVKYYICCFSAFSTPPQLLYIIPYLCFANKKILQCEHYRTFQKQLLCCQICPEQSNPLMPTVGSPGYGEMGLEFW